MMGRFFVFFPPRCTSYFFQFVYKGEEHERHWKDIKTLIKQDERFMCRAFFHLGLLPHIVVDMKFVYVTRIELSRSTCAR